jgi:hypothetical protein
VLAAALALGFAAVNTANNLLYLVTSLVLGLIAVSGVLSERTIRGLRLSVTPPDEVFARRGTLFVATVENAKRWSASYSVMIEVARHTGAPALGYIPRLRPGHRHVITWEDVIPERGRQRPSGSPPSSPSGCSGNRPPPRSARRSSCSPRSGTWLRARRPPPRPGARGAGGAAGASSCTTSGTTDPVTIHG